MSDTPIGLWRSHSIIQFKITRLTLQRFYVKYCFKRTNFIRQHIKCEDVDDAPWKELAEERFQYRESFESTAKAGIRNFRKA